MTLIATVQAEARPPRVKLETDGTSVTRTDSSGLVVSVRGDVVDGVIYDYEAPQGVALTYEADSGGTEVAAMPAGETWLVHLSRPEMSCALLVQAESDVDLPARVSSVRTFSGRPFSVAAGNRDAISSAMTVHSLTREMTADLLALLYDQSILFFSPHPEHDDEGPRYVRILDVSKARFMAACESPRRILSLPYLISDRPAGATADAYGWDLMPTSWAAMPTSWSGMP